MGVSGKGLWRLLSFAMVLCILIGMIPVPALAAEDQPDGNQNDVTVPAEAWSPDPGGVTDRGSTSVLAGTSSADIVNVTVTATDSRTGSTVTVPGATVNLNVGSEVHSTWTDDNNDGIVEVSMADLSYEQRLAATVSAYKVVSRGKAIGGDDRDPLFQYYPEDEDGEYYRYTMELHSETIDENGNWVGAEIPAGTGSNKVDIVFIIDSTGSMFDEINNVKNNIASFSQNLTESGLDNRFCIIDYRDITIDGEETNVHTRSGTHWLEDIDSVVDALGSIDVRGGGDDPETLLDPLGYVADNSLMQWRSDAYRFAFILTDAGYKLENNYGYDSMEEMIRQLKEMEVVTSVITSDAQNENYSDLYEQTGGIYADIFSRTFDQEMMTLSDSIVEYVTQDMTLHLSEPRMLVNMSVCYFADDSTSQSASYRDSVKNVMRVFGNILAESTDGHMLLDNVILFSTTNRTHFYNTSKLPSMADIRIETKVRDPGRGGANATIHSNAYVSGFYTDATEVAYTNGFKNLSSLSGIDGSRSFLRIQMGGTTYSWNVTFTDPNKVYEYASTILHEAGHYLLGFYDEYLDGYDNQWVYNKPYAAGYGLMDNHHYGDIEISKTNIDYAYMTAGFNRTPQSLHTYQSYTNGGSCEDSLAALLTDSALPAYCNNIRRTMLASGYTIGDYRNSYTKTAGPNDRGAAYPYAALTDEDFIYLPASTGDRTAAAVDAPRDGSEENLTREVLADVTFTANGNKVTMNLEAAAGNACTVSILKYGEDTYSGVRMILGRANLDIARGEMAEIRVSSGGRYNSYYIARSEETDAGYMYTSADNAVMAYVTTSEANEYSFVADNLSYRNGTYCSVNQATRITGDFEGGEIYSVADFMDEIDYTTLQWFKYADGTWTALETDQSEEENMNLGARADLDGEGLYVLMAEEAPEGGALPALNLEFIQSEIKDGVVFIRFTDPNANARYYNVYFSDEPFISPHEDGVSVRSIRADFTQIPLNLLQRIRTVYAALEIVLEDGSRSTLSDIVLFSGVADSDSDGIPDWYCDLYHLWGEEGEDKDIAGSDDDGDGLTNLEEFLGGSDPTNPNDPVHTTNVPVASISVSDTDVHLSVGQTAEITATVLPANATDKSVSWSCADPAVAGIEVSGGVCRVTGREVGETQIYAVTSDGGFSAVIDVTVSEEGGGEAPDSGVVRLAGSDRYATCISVANRLKEKLGVDQFEAVVIAYGQNFPDALTGSYLAAVKNAPILLWENAVDARMMVYIAENLAPGGTIYILGGESVVSASVENAARYFGYNPVRLKGANRYDTNLAILSEAGVNTTDDILIATGKNYADSLSASATGLPMLLVGDELTAAQSNFLLTTSRRFVIIGGTGAVSESVEEELALLGTVVRIKGSSRYETSVEIARRYFEDPQSVVLAYSHGFPDGLCGGPLALSMGAPMILTSNDGYEVADWYVHGIHTGAVTGGTGRISDETVRNIFELEADTFIPRR